MNARRSLAHGLLALALLAPAGAAAETFAPDPARTRLGFHADTVLVPVDGAFARYQVTISGDPKTLQGARIAVTIDAASVSSGYDMRDDHIRSRDFLDVKRYPRIAFTSQRVTRQGAQLLVTGTLSLHGVKKELQIPFTAEPGKSPGEWLFHGALTLDRRDFRIGTESVIKEKAVKDAIKLDLTLAGVFK